MRGREGGTGRGPSAGRASARWTRSILVGTAVGVLGALPGPVLGQSAPEERIDAPTVTLTGGAFVRTDFRSEGTAPVWGVRFRFPLGRWVAIEPALHLTSFTVDDPPEGVDREGRLTTVDFQLQLQLPTGRIRPYVGVGAGGGADFREERGADDFIVSTFTGAVGVRVGMTEQLHLVGEARLRSLDEFAESGVGLHAGVGWRF